VFLPPEGNAFKNIGVLGRLNPPWYIQGQQTGQAQ